MTEEILDIVNDKDEIIGQASHAEMHKLQLMHHVVIAMVLNEEDEVLLQLRAKNKSAHPSHWSFSMGGHVRHGETYEKALKREAREEIGITISEDQCVLKGQGKLKEQSGADVLYRAYEVRYDGPIEEHTEEVDAVQFVTWKELRTMIDDGKEKIHPQMITALKSHWAKELGY